MKPLHITMIQMDIVKGDFDANCRTIEKLLQQATQPPDLLMLPEMWSVGFDYRRMKHHGKALSKTLSFLNHLACHYHTVVMGGSIPEAKGDRLFNTTYVLNPDGTTQDRYRKMHLVSQRHLEEKTFNRGNRIPLFQATDVSFGVANCYDIMFPETTRGIAQQGAQLVAVPAQYSSPFFDQWMTLLKARAMENQVFVAAVNRVGANYFGHSCVISPTGKMLYEANDQEQLIEFTIDSGQVEKKRAIRHHARQINEMALMKWVYPQNFIGVGGLVERDGRFLMVRQNYGRIKGYWLLPGGHLDKGEAPEVGAAREIMEETSVRTRALELLALRNLRVNGVVDSYQVYRMKDLGGEPVPDGFENTEAAFLSPDEIFNEKPVTHLAKAIVRKVLSGDKDGLQLQTDFVKHSEDYQLYL
ncbi:nitrilase-related carbon-nitrogen hydrolase [Anoxynatronum sibiricum]|uniref:Nitrilase-related carbon-nitrogen hydrolase n=1 Tax=Anoxynatronum sibiricum TaxID=210623 RepID=A0ABU9VR37_9CLOT